MARRCAGRGAGYHCPIHDYGVFGSPLSHFTDEMRRRGTDAHVRLVHRGETAPLPARPAPDPTTPDPSVRPR